MSYVKGWVGGAASEGRCSDMNLLRGYMVNNRIGCSKDGGKDWCGGPHRRAVARVP